MPMGTLDLSPLVEAVSADLIERARLRGIRLVVIAPENGAVISGNESALRRLVFGLLDNAVKYSPSGGEVRVELAQTGGVVALEVRDYGIGIPEPALSRIFERFYRAEDARLKAAEGYGLGLSLVDGIAQRHGARIRVVSALGQGSTFRVEFPAACDSEWRPVAALNR
jgi:signal transduction histidine kinase